MNNKRKILTIVALGIFAAIIGLHYVGFYQGIPEFRYPSVKVTHSAPPFREETITRDNIINDVRMPLFVLAVFYAGFFFILGPAATKEPPA